MNKNNLQLSDQQFPLPYNAYAAFDALTLKQLMVNRLTENAVFTDQIYEGSNFNSFIDVIAYSYNVLLYYLNKTSNESLFGSSQIYENMNKIVKILNYNPIGFQTSLLKFEATAGVNLPRGIYTVPKYSYFNINEIRYSFTRDSTFIKAVTGEQFLSNFSGDSYLLQGEWVENPVYTATGEPFENFSIVSVDRDGENVKIDHNSIDVYVQNEFGEWEEWQRVDSLYLGNGNDKIYEARLNENLRYSIKFGNNITGKQLKLNDKVAVYYLKTNLNLGQVGPNTLNDSKLFIYNTKQYNEINKFVRDQNLNLLSQANANVLTFRNKLASSTTATNETTEQIRVNAPNLFKSQARLVTTRDFESYIETGFRNLVHDVAVVDNWGYLDGHMKYLYNLGLKSPSTDSRVLYNQVKFSDSNNFNNVYVYIVPKIFTTNSYVKDATYLNPTAKQNILNSLDRIKMTSIEVIPQDPVYVGIGIGIMKDVGYENDTVESILNNSRLIIKKTDNTYTSENSTIQKITNIFKEYFKPSSVTLGMVIDLEEIIGEILKITGVTGVYTSRKFPNGEEIVTEGISLLLFNPVYSNIKEDVTTTSQNTSLPYFKIPFIYNLDQITNNILIEDGNSVGIGLQGY